MTVDELAALVAAVGLIVGGAIVRQLWRLADRVARLEGRIDPRHREGNEHRDRH